MRSVFFLSLLLACRAQPQKAPPLAEDHTPPKLDMRLRPGLLFSYLDAQGEQRSTESLAEIPEDRRAGVRVIDLNVPPEQRGAGKWVFVADLRAPKADGSYPYQTLSLVGFERAVVSTTARQKVAEALAVSASQVTVYSTSWCSVCQQAKAYLRQRNVPFVERDVEKDQSAALELHEKAKRAGMSPQGVPVIDVYGELMMGFDAARLEALLEKKRTQTL